MNRTLKVTALAATAAGLLAVPALAADDSTALAQTAQSKPVQINPGNTHTVVGQAGITARGKLIVRLAAPDVDEDDAIAQTSKVIVAAAPALGKVCGTGTDSGELVTRAGKGSSCKAGLPLMRAWRKADNPRRFRSYRCGDVPGTHVEFRGDERWFASWQCTRGSIAYRVWTQL